MIDKEKLRQIEQNAEERFDERIKEQGRSARGLGWDEKSSMLTRFEAATEMYDFTNKRVLDVGCGFGDFFGFLQDRECEPAEYYGVDVAKRALDIAREEHPDTVCRFERRNPLLDPFKDEQFDITVEFGILNFNFEGLSNERYIRHYMGTCYGFSDAVLVNGLSNYREGDWEYEEFVHYYSPEKVFGYAQELSRDVVLKHDFEPIPQKEFHLLVR